MQGTGIDLSYLFRDWCYFKNTVQYQIIPVQMEEYFN